MRFNQQIKQHPANDPPDIPLNPKGVCRDPRLSKRYFRPCHQLALVNFRPPSAIQSPTENHVTLEVSGHENMPDAFPEMPQNTERFNGLRLSERFAKVHQDGVVRSPLSEIVAPKEDVSKLRFPLHPVQKIPNFPCHQQSMVPREASVAPERPARQTHIYANGSDSTTDPSSRRFVDCRADGAMDYVSNPNSEPEYEEMTTMTQNRPTVNGSSAVNGSTAVNIGTTPEVLNIQRSGTPQLSESSSESEFSDSDDLDGEEEDGVAASAVEPCIPDQEEKENKQERRWAMENFIPKHTYLVDLTASNDLVTTDVVPETCSDSQDCFDTPSLFDGLTLKPFPEHLEVTKLDPSSLPAAIRCDALPQPTVAIENSTPEGQSTLLLPAQSSTSQTTRKRTRDSSSNSYHSKKSKAEEAKSTKSSSTRHHENGSLRNEGKAFPVSLSQPSTITTSKMSQKRSMDSLKNSKRDEVKVDKCQSSSSTPGNGSALHGNVLTRHEEQNGLAHHHGNALARHEVQSLSLPPSELSATSKASHKSSRDRGSEKQRSKKSKADDSISSVSSSALLCRNGLSKIHSETPQPRLGSAQKPGESTRNDAGSAGETSESTQPPSHVSQTPVVSSRLKGEPSKDHNSSMRTENRSLRTENGLTLPQTELTLTQNALTSPQNALTLTKNALTSPQKALTSPQNALTLTQNALTSPQNGPCAIVHGDQPLDRRRESGCDKNHKERLLPALHYNGERQRLETQSLTMNPESLSKFMMLTEALNSFVCYAFAYEQQISQINSGKEFEKALAFSKKVCDQQTIQLIQHPWKNHVLVICHRLQAVIHFKCYRKNEVGKLKLLLEEQLTKMQPPKRMVGDTGNRSQGETLSPIMQQPTPSPAGSVTSVGSSGSGVERAASMSPNFVISSRTHSLLKSYMNYMTHLGESHDCWKRSIDIVKGDSDCRQFFASVDAECGPVNESSPILAISNYVLTALSRLRKRRDTTGRR